MSPLDRPVPPAGEEIHLPGGSLQPLLLALGITLAIVGITVSIVMLAAGLILTLVVVIAWIRDARREMDALPLDHDAH